jgi:UDP-glucuronate 4-epimerase
MILITGACGFIGYHLSKRLSPFHFIAGLDNFNPYYDPSLKEYRRSLMGIPIYNVDITDKESLEVVFKEVKPSTVIHLAAYPGVRYSIEHPEIYTDTNIIGFRNILECCRRYGSKLIYASSSSVYGDGEPPYRETDKVNPISPYAMSKLCNEQDAYEYFSKYGVPSIGFRFFSVYGPYGRPDMAYYKFVDKLMQHQPIDLYNKGNNLRDYTYVGDVVDAIQRVIQYNTKCDVFNIGNGSPVSTLELLNIITRCLHNRGVDVRPNIRLHDPVEGESLVTHADTSLYESTFGPLLHTSLRVGMDKFIAWYLSYY